MAATPGRYAYQIYTKYKAYILSLPMVLQPSAVVCSHKVHLRGISCYSDALVRPHSLGVGSSSHGHVTIPRSSSFKQSEFDCERG